MCFPKPPWISIPHIFGTCFFYRLKEFWNVLSRCPIGVDGELPSCLRSFAKSEVFNPFNLLDQSKPAKGPAIYGTLLSCVAGIIMCQPILKWIVVHLRGTKAWQGELPWILLRLFKGFQIEKICYPAVGDVSLYLFNI